MGKDADKWKYSFYGAVLFFVIANPLVYKIVHTLTKPLGIPRVLDAYGSPSQFGVALHALVYLLAVRLTMELK